MKRTADVAIVGAGIYGCAIAHALASSGKSVLVLERDSEPACGPTRRSGACTRQFYGDPRLSALAKEALALAWNRWPAFTGLRDPEAAHHRGTLALAPPASPRGLPILQLPPNVDAIDLFAANLRKSGVRGFEVLEGRALSKRFPFLRLAGVRGLWEPDSGYVAEPAGAARDLARAARKKSRGISFYFGRPATAVRRSGRDWTVATPAGPVTCASLVLAAGAWTAALLPFPLPGRHRLRVDRVAISYLGHPGPAPVVADAALGAYFRPRRSGLFVASLADEKTTLRNPDDLDPRSAGNSPAAAAAKRRFRDLTPVPRNGAAALYDLNAFDGNPVVDRLAPGLFAAWLFSGHGFKFSPAVAAALAPAILEDRMPALPFPAIR